MTLLSSRGIFSSSQSTHFSHETSLIDGHTPAAVSWAVSCEKTECRENQDGWTVSITSCEGETLRWSHERISGGASKLSANNSGGTSVNLGNSSTKPTNSFVNVDNVSGSPAASATFVVLDGHGYGGRQASAAVEEAFCDVFGLDAENIAPTPPPQDTPVGVLHKVHQSLGAAQKKIEQLNCEMQRDFGTTCVVVSVVKDFLIASGCGDSSALLVVLPPSDQGPGPVLIELARRHSLTDKDEVERIQAGSGGQIVRGDGGILRLIPKTMDYEEAKRRGLSINMSRSLGHAVFSNFGLSHMPDYSFFALKQLPKLLAGFDQVGIKHFRLPPFNYPECRQLLEGSSRHKQSSRRSGWSSIPNSTSAAAMDSTGGGVDGHSHHRPQRTTSASVDQLQNKLGAVFVLLMTDGITDVLSSMCIIKLLRSSQRLLETGQVYYDLPSFTLNLTEVAKERRSRSFHRADNCTCLIARLQ